MSDRNDEINVYQDKKARSEDYKSSAYTPVLTGAIGLIALMIMIMDVLPARIIGKGKYVTYGVTGGMFVVFIVMGISSFRSSKDTPGKQRTRKSFMLNCLRGTDGQ